jgi:hypothetical protein
MVQVPEMTISSLYLKQIEKVLKNKDSLFETYDGLN